MLQLAGVWLLGARAMGVPAHRPRPWGHLPAISSEFWRRSKIIWNRKVNCTKSRKHWKVNIQLNSDQGQKAFENLDKMVLDNILTCWKFNCRLAKSVLTTNCSVFLFQLLLFEEVVGCCPSGKLWATQTYVVEQTEKSHLFGLRFQLPPQWVGKPRPTVCMATFRRLLRPTFTAID